MAAADELDGNIRAGGKSRKALKRGDVFGVDFPAIGWVYGRVVATDAKVPHVENLNLVYLFKDVVKSGATPPMPNRATLRADNLLIPPLMMDRIAWSRGVFQPLGNLPIEGDEVRKEHYFKVKFWDEGWEFFDEYGARLEAIEEPAAIHGVAHYGVADRLISKELGLPVIPSGRGLNN